MSQVYQEITAALTWPIGDLRTMSWSELAGHWADARDILDARLKAQRKAERDANRKRR